MLSCYNTFIVGEHTKKDKKKITIYCALEINKEGNNSGDSCRGGV
jgi:hypothetical protein